MGQLKSSCAFVGWLPKTTETTGAGQKTVGDGFACVEAMGMCHNRQTVPVGDPCSSLWIQMGQHRSKEALFTCSQAMEKAGQ